jgi:ABC-type multidrug transport system ATPase subunit
MVTPAGYRAYLHSYGWAGKIKLTVRDFFLQTLLLLHRPTKDLGAQLRTMGIDGFENQKLTSLSSGQLQRCLTEVAFLQDAPILLFDEPLNALDFLNQELFIAKTKEALGAGRSVLVSSHIDSILDIDFESVLILHDGRQVACESLENLKMQQLTFKEYYERTIRAL